MFAPESGQLAKLIKWIKSIFPECKCQNETFSIYTPPPPPRKVRGISSTPPAVEQAAYRAKTGRNAALNVARALN